MALIVEDGSIVANANTYVTLLEVTAFATDRGITLPDDATVTQKIFVAMDWFEGNSFISIRVDVDTPQALSFPRVGIVIDGITIPDTTVAQLVKDIIIQATIDATTIDLEPSIAGAATGALKKKKVDVIEREYFEASFSDALPQLTRLHKMLAPLLGGSGLSVGRLQVARV